MKQGFSRYFFSIVLGLGLVAFYMPRISADESIPDSGDTLDLVVGDIETIPVHSLTRVSVTDPDIADISDAQSDKVLVMAKKAGQTILYLWDSGGKRSMEVRVVSEDLKTVKERVQKVLDEANVTGVSLEENHDVGKVVVSGNLTKTDKTRLGEVLEPYSENLLNLVKVHESDDLVEVDMQIVEISTTFEKNLGITWSNAIGTNESTSTQNGSAASNSGLNLPYTETPPSTNGKIGDFFKVGDFNRTFQLQATVNALLQEGKARLISKPRLVVVSGKQASFLVGGEIPVQSTTENTGGTTSTSSTTYSQYGVNMLVTPTIREGKIDVVLNVDIRDIDASTPLSGNSGSNVAFVTRTASTDLYMDNKQTIVLAGLIKYADNVTVTEVPFLSKIPILGALFRNKSSGFPSADTNTEMVIILTPTVLTDKKFADKQVVMPTPSERDAYKEWDAKYEHEPVPSGWPVATAQGPATVKDSSGDVGAMSAYARLVQEKISRSISYPPTAMGNAWAGTVKLKLHILKDGSLDSEEVMESSGYDVLDQDAMNAAKMAAPYDAFTTGMDQEDLIFTVPIVYNKLTSESQSPAGKALVTY